MNYGTIFFNKGIFFITNTIAKQIPHTIKTPIVLHSNALFEKCKIMGNLSTKYI